ncbi:hypothetical protein KW517_01290 [Vibrio fluvialis]|uniref:MFS transporter n=1 Tax=Vibrio fluvialis TaxID=676 RepID=UPI00117FAE58|nr:MFS transporter [Vibrio fluvialis]MBL4287665.1 hypothetical protein [Vibrio fluvialis]MBL4291852.1 hypothetical protein [Vibrio fluvialis]MBY8097252.1 hypothetical protein [Vibrio fluvialis]MBY8212650.1 hypothetical protein [Vibrio fluvialis]
MNYAIAAWLPQWLSAQGESATAANQYTFVFIIVGTLTSLTYPLFVASLRHSERRTVLLATTLLILAPICYEANSPDHHLEYDSDRWLPGLLAEAITRLS